MDFHLNFDPKPFAVKIEHHQKLLLIGSCFTENIGSKLRQLKFSVLENPNGILFNPVSIATSLNSYIENKQYKEEELFYQNESWNSWQHHSRFSNPDKAATLAVINQSQQTAHSFLKTANWVLITLGSAFVYELENKEIVANCHKVPTDKFNKKLLSADEITKMLKEVMEKLSAFNPNIKIIFTISPVRHLRDGFVENNRSKAMLIQAVHQLVSENDTVFYFPAYELVIDDLRDYRFYAEDMVHPNYAATNYVWEKFITTCIDERTVQLMKEINIINAAKSHKPFNPTSAQHKKFLQTNLDKVTRLQEEHTYLDLREEINFFRRS
ncbi:MAG TPA: GSCFA domain-containing protein [Ferruginibacter sp.]|nr:GSCFA domain-containing protein [Ferruginibacter sp.]